MTKNDIGYRVGDYVKIRVYDVDFKGRIIKFIYENKGDAIPTKAYVEVCSTNKKVSGVTKSTMTVAFSFLSPLL